MVAEAPGRRWLVHLPNLITIARMVAIFPLIWLLVDRQYFGALLVAAAAGLSDAVDGYLAKRFGWQSDLGGMLDPLADKLLLICCFIVLATQGAIPAWLLILVLGRDFLIVAGATCFHFYIRPVTAAPTAISKINTFLQIALVLMVLVELTWPQVPKPVIIALIWLTCASTILSGIHYVWKWGTMAWRESRPRKMQEQTNDHTHE